MIGMLLGVLTVVLIHAVWGFFSIRREMKRWEAQSSFMFPHIDIKKHDFTAPSLSEEEIKKWVEINHHIARWHHMEDK